MIIIAKKKIKFAALSGGYMASSILGIMISLMYVFPNSFTWGITSTFLFGIMFIASVLSMTYADTDDLINLDDFEREKKRKNKTRKKSKKKTQKK